MIDSTHFDGIARRLKNFMIDLKGISVSRSWRKLFEMTLFTNKRLKTTNITWAGTSINYLDNHQAMSFEDVIHTNNTNRTLVLSQKNKQKNFHSAVWNTRTHMIRPLNHCIRYSYYRAWIYETYSMQTGEAQKNFLSKITSLTISKSKSVENFLIYVEEILNDGNAIGQDQKEMFRDATLLELTKITCSTFTTTLLA